MTIPAAESAHLPFGGSSAARWLSCHGFVGLAATLPAKPASPAMLAGTRAHSLLEHLLRSGGDALDYEGRRLDSEPFGGPAYTEEDVVAVQMGVDYVRDILTRHPDAQIWLELKVKLAPDVGGTADVVIYIPSLKHLHLIDYKHGAGKFVDADDNAQVKLYATSTVDQLGLDVKVIYGTIIQPRSREGDPIRTAPLSVADLIIFADRVEEAVAAAKGPSPTFNPSPSNCHWCQCAPVCPALLNQATEPFKVPAAAFARDPEPNQIRLMLPEAEWVRSYPQAAGTVLASIELLEVWIDSVKDHIQSMAMSGQAINGYKLVRTRPTRKWADPDKAEAWLADYLLSSQYKPPKLLTVPQVEKLLKDQPAEAKAEFAALYDKESSGYKLVPESAVGVAVSPSATMAAEFSSVRPLTTET